MPTLGWCSFGRTRCLGCCFIVPLSWNAPSTYTNPRWSARTVAILSLTPMSLVASPATSKDEQRQHQPLAPVAPQSHVAKVKNTWASVTHHLKSHVGVGVMCAVAYFDPCVLHSLFRLPGLIVMQRKLECRSPGRLGIWVQAALRRARIWALCSCPPGALCECSLRIASQLMAVQILAAKLGCVTGLGAFISVQIVTRIVYPVQQTWQHTAGYSSMTIRNTPG